MENTIQINTETKQTITPEQEAKLIAGVQDLFNRDTAEMVSVANESPSRPFAIIERMDYDLVDEMFMTLHFCFHPNGFEDEFEDDEIDPRLMALWTLFLSTVGWTEEEFWEVSNARSKEAKENAAKNETVEVSKETAAN